MTAFSKATRGGKGGGGEGSGEGDVGRDGRGEGGGGAIFRIVMPLTSLLSDNNRKIWVLTETTLRV